MFSEKALLDTQADVAKAATAGTIAHLLESYRTGSDMFPNPWIYATVASLVGFVVHGLVVSQVVKPSTGNAQVDAGLADVVKVGTVLAVSQAINSAMAGGVAFPDSWMNSTAITLAAFFAFHVVAAPYVPEIPMLSSPATADVAKVTFTSLAIQYVSGGEVNTEYLISLAATLAGFVVFHEVVAPRLLA